MISGGNIDSNLLDRIIGYGLAKAGRLTRLHVDLHDQPGELQKLLALISESGANVRTIVHERVRRDIPIGSARVTLELETRGTDHIHDVWRRLVERGYRIAAQDPPPSGRAR